MKTNSKLFSIFLKQLSNTPAKYTPTLLNNARMFVFIPALTILLFAGCKKTETPPAPPTAGFSFATPAAGILPTLVNFTSSSTGATSYQWSFGDGNQSALANPSNTYTSAKTYNVKLVVTGPGGADSITKTVTITLDKPKPSFTFLIQDNGNLPTHVNFTNTSTGASTYKWVFGNGDTSSATNPVDSFFAPKTFKVKLIATNAAGADSASQDVAVNITGPAADFGYTVTNPYHLPLSIACTNTSLRATSYKWDFGDGANSTVQAPNHTYTKGGIYNIKIVVTNPGGSDSETKVIRVSPYPVTYTSFNNKQYNLYAWEGKTVMLLMRTPGLAPATMFKWAQVMDSSYGYYYAATGQFPIKYAPLTYINDHVTIADVDNTCGAGCGYLGFTGIEMLNAYTDRMYSYALQNRYDQELFYECGRNFWFYGDQLAYKTNDPVTTAYAIFMRFMAMDAVGVDPAPFNNIAWTTFRTDLEDLVNIYTSNSSYTWANTLGVSAGVTNPLGLGAGDLFASFCIKLKHDYGGEAFVQNLWKQAGLRPKAVTTQDAVDNFILAACAAANKNLTTLFTTTWRWPMSDAAKTEANKYP